MTVSDSMTVFAPTHPQNKEESAKTWEHDFKATLHMMHQLNIWMVIPFPTEKCSHLSHNQGLKLIVLEIPNHNKINESKQKQKKAMKQKWILIIVTLPLSHILWYAKKIRMIMLQYLEALRNVNMTRLVPCFFGMGKYELSFEDRHKFYQNDKTQAWGKIWQLKQTIKAFYHNYKPLCLRNRMIISSLYHC